MAQHVKFRYRLQKTIAAIARLIRLDGSDRMGYYRILKLLYLADRESIRCSAGPITGDTASAMPHGPTPSCTCDMVRETGLFPEYQDTWDRYFRTEQRILVLMADPGEGALSDFDVQVIDDTYREFGGRSGNQLYGYVHTLPEFKQNKPKGNRGSQPIPFEDIARAVGGVDLEAMRLEAEDAELMASLYGD